MSKFPTIKNNEEIGADIRNKLTPLKNLVSLIRRYKIIEDPEIKKSIWELIIRSLNQCDISIEYLTKLL